MRIRGITSKHREAGQDHWQPIPQDLAKALAIYAMSHQSECLFPDRWGKRRNAQALLRAFYLDCDAAGIDRGDGEIDIHCLRATYVTELSDPALGLNPKEVSLLARHKDIGTTMRYYVKADDEKARRAVDALRIGGLGGERA